MIIGIDNIIQLTRYTINICELCFNIRITLKK